MEKMQICIWCNGDADEVVAFYNSVFKDFKEHGRMVVPPGLPMPEGSVLTVDFSLNGMRFMALRGGNGWQTEFNESVSVMVMCDTQDEIDAYWDKLAAGGGKHVQCGWLQDKFGLRWQVVPAKFREWSKGSPEQVSRYMTAMMSMKKLDIAALEKAYEG